MNDIKIVMLGTGNPNANPDRSGPAVAIVVNDRSYLIDIGPGIVRQAAKASIANHIKPLKPKNLNTVFVTHLHSDHTAGFPDLILSPWVLGRKSPLKVYGPKGIASMSEHLLNAYSIDISGRLNGFEPANENGYRVDATEINAGLIYSDSYLSVDAFKVEHEPFESYGFRFNIGDKSIVISGDTAPCKGIIEYGRNCDVLIHEVYSAKGLSERTSAWQKYHSSLHTSSIEVGEIAHKTGAKKLVLYHQLFMTNLQEDAEDTSEILLKRESEMITDIKKSYKGEIVFAEDLDIITI